MTPGKRSDRELLEEVAGNVRDMKINLLGDPNDATDLGRVPRLESKARSSEQRIQRLERFRWYLAGLLVGVAYMMERVLHR